jgi:hypothetical protein
VLDPPAAQALPRMHAPYLLSKHMRTWVLVETHELHGWLPRKGETLSAGVTVVRLICVWQWVMARL